MRSVVLSMYMSLDGVVEDPGGTEEFDHGGWSLPFFDRDAAAFARKQLFGADALLLGRVTYQAFAEAWPSMTDEDGFAERINQLPKHVASGTQKTTTWNATIIGRDVRGEVTRLKHEPGQDILVYGSIGLARTLHEHGLIDEYRLWVHPVLLGAGRRLFTDGIPETLTLADTTTFASGVVVLTYQRRK